MAADRASLTKYLPQSTPDLNIQTTRQKLIIILLQLEVLISFEQVQSWLLLIHN